MTAFQNRNYHIQNGCYCCSFSFVRYEYDGCNQYFCFFSDPDRPICMSVAMGEMPEDFHKKRNFKVYAMALKEWSKWAEENKVEPWGICDKFQMIGVKEA
jgi:hypothetical protein